MKILVAEDDPVSSHHLEAILTTWGYEVMTCADGPTAWRAIEETGHNLLLLDWMMPGMTGLEICRKIRERKTEQYTYILLLTAKTEREEIVEGMESGADDYLTKPFSPHELRVRLRAGRRILELNEELVDARNTLREKALHDSLTGVWNRETVLEMLGHEMERANREKADLSIAMLDIDHFKKVNDTHGHLAGDEVLRKTSKNLLSTLRSYDMIGRYGGEEFLVILPGCNTDDAMKQADRLRAFVDAHPVDTAGGMIPVTVSIGVAMHYGHEPTEMEFLLQTADDALYRAKEKGRNRCEQ